MYLMTALKCTIWCYLVLICIIFDANVASQSKKYAGTASPKGAIWGKFSETHQQKSNMFNAKLAALFANKVQI